MNVVFQSSPWWILPCLLAGGLYAFLLYQPQPSWSKRTNLLLAALRFLSVTGLCLLLLNLLLRQTEIRVEKKTVVLALDNSASLGKAGAAAIPGLQSLRESLEDKGYAVEWQTLQDRPPATLDSVRFNQKTTDLSRLLGTVKSNFEGRNVTDVILLSDGIVNQGTSPAFGSYSFPIHTIAVGDTVPKKDVSIKSVYANQIAYLGNQFPVQAEVRADGYAGRSATVTLRRGGEVVGQQAVSFPRESNVVSVQFLAQAQAKGVQHLVVEVTPLPGEHTVQNNRRDVYVEVIDGRQKILLVASAPHPDIKALRSIIEKNENLEFQFQIVNPLSPAPATDQKYDLVIFHQQPDQTNSSAGYLKKWLDSGTPVFWIVGAQTNLNALNNLQQAAQVLSQGSQTDQVTGFYNRNFTRLNLDAAQMELIRKLPPMTVPFGDVRVLANSEVVLYQKKNNVETTKPLLLLHSGGRRSAVLLGEGLWEWRLEEYNLTEKQEVVDGLFTKIIQYLSSKDDKRKLRVYPVQNQFQTEERVSFETEIYNDIYERIYGQTVNLKVTGEKGEPRTYSYTASQSRFDISNLPAGVYHYSATAKVLGKDESAAGQFVVRDEQMELSNTTADFNLLRQLSQQTSGHFYLANQIPELTARLEKRDTPDRISSTEDLREAINLRWVFFLLVALLTLEWGVRKFMGGY